MSGREHRFAAVRRLPDAVVERLRSADGLVVGLDFDGTLAPVAADADEPAITQSNREALVMLADRADATPAVVSGRSLSDLRSRVDVDGVLYAGNHGLELSGGHPALVDGRPDVEEHRPAVAGACEAIRRQVGGVLGCEVEDKGLTATVHYRRSPVDRVQEIREAVARATDGDESLRLRSAKQALEIRPAVEWDKGSVVRGLSRWAPDGWRTVYLGDDVTDEDGFRALGPADVGIRIDGSGGEDTAADVRLPDHRSTATFLHWLAEDALAG